MAEAREAMAEEREGVALKEEEEHPSIQEKKKKNEEASMIVGLPLVGGIRRQQVKVLAEEAGVCKECRQGKGAFVKYDNVLEVFHMPLWRWPGRNPALVCSVCSHWIWTSHFEPLPTLESDDLDAIHPTSPNIQERDSSTFHCWSCSHLIDTPTFKFCPSCGSRQDFW